MFKHKMKGGIVLKNIYTYNNNSYDSQYLNGVYEF